MTHNQEKVVQPVLDTILHGEEKIILTCSSQTQRDIMVEHTLLNSFIYLPRSFPPRPSNL